MNNNAKIAVIDYLSFMETSGKISHQESSKLRKALEPNAENKNIPVIFLTRQEVAKILKVSTRNLDRIRSRGEINFRRIGLRRIRFTLKDVLEYANVEEG